MIAATGFILIFQPEQTSTTNCGYCPFPVTMLYKLYNIIPGTDKDFSFEHRIFNLSCFVIAIFCIQGTVINYLIGLHPATVWLAVAGTVIVIAIFYLTRILKIFNEVLLLLFGIATIGILGPMHFFNGASSGPVIYLLIMLLTIFLIIAPTGLHFLLYALFVTSILCLLLIEYMHPAWVVNYANSTQRLIDHSTVLLYSLFFTYIVAWLFRRSYGREQRTIILQKKELESLYDEAREKNKYIESLIRELHHRVKNNLQVVSSLMSLQSNRIEDEKARTALEEGKTRVDAMALIHQKLYVDHELASVNMSAYLAELTASLAGSFGLPPYTVETGVELVNPSMNIDKAVSIGLIVNELVTNACKHAFKHISHPKIYIQLRQQQNQLLLSIADNGVGVKKNDEVENSFGLKLVRILVNQLDATMQVTNKDGTSYLIQMKAE